MQNHEPQRTPVRFPFRKLRVVQGRLRNGEEFEKPEILPLIDADDTDHENQNLEPQRAQRHTEETRGDYFLLKLSMLSAFSFSAISKKASTISSGWSRWIQCALLAAMRCLPCNEWAAMAWCSAIR